MLDAVERVLRERGDAGLTLRAVAQAAGLSLGSVSHFGSRESLVERCVERLAERYAAELIRLEAACPDDPRAAFRATIELLVADLRNEDDGADLFPELWALAGRNTRVAEALSRLYARERDWLEQLLAAGWPDADAERLRTVVGVLVPAIEGLVLFTGPDRPPLYANFDAAQALETWIETLMIAKGR